jgi:hypothetical protein
MGATWDFIHHTVDAATFTSDQETLHCITHSVVKWAKICIEAKDRHFEHLLHH